MPSTFSLGALALLLSASGLAIPAFADPGQSASSPLIAMVREAETTDPAPELKGDVAIREVQPELDLVPQPRQVVPQPIAPVPQPRRVKQVSSGEASWYGPGFFGNRTANGEVFRPGTLTAAHRTLPFGTKVRVTNLWNGRSTEVRINDRGPFHGNRIIDLAHGAAQRLGLTASGIAQVRLEVLQ
ncbi:septal ring lytic transglycosylase RlpA family protein [Synechococcus sp. Tobar12-5m-g]|uniref:septal ring lytic transglycosylase RlpA family protein n=1 Tax=unclassified Synechococcus TaxID=2626047 RepID=UPI0020CC433C|nr:MULTISPECIES: septal ring lytic transglycosylase RlpA family protein [unclassified Synechococcus]MCP9772973.1 septal ring lytic transglycosylase RlpA family protein [Synechococcus sp. Tobar12-5m-g]MCP9873878.1 septal ring lytic transglycosylase RlpA family protein [Synechococcus sp. Cruz CV-v-12]